jgi:hypothetical protein
MRKYKEALGPIDEAIKVAEKTRGAAYPTITIMAKVAEQCCKFWIIQE